MNGDLLIFLLLQMLIFLFGIAVGHSLLLLKIRKENNRSKALEIALINKRKQMMSQGKRIADDLEEVLYKAKIQQEIDNIIRKNSSQ